MSGFRVQSFLVFTFTALLLLLTHFYLNPAKFESHCLAAHASSPELGEGPIIDCVACLHLDARDLISAPIVGSVQILMERMNDQDKQQSSGTGPLHDKWIFLGDVYGQHGCLSYECPSLLLPSDFQMTNPDTYKLLSSLQISQLQGVYFRRQSNSFKSLVFTGSPQLYNLKLTSTAVSAEVSSLVVRFRTNLADKADGSKQPQFLLFSIPNTIFVRLLLLAPLLLELPRLRALLFGVGVIPGILMLLSIGCSFICQETAVLSSLICVYLLLGQLAGLKMIASNCALILISAYLAYTKNILPLPLLCLTISAIIPVYFAKGKQSQPYLVHTIFLVSFELLIAVVYEWSFLAVCAPMHMLLAVVLSAEEGKKEERQRYHGVRIEEEEDVMVRIDRMLERTE